MSPATNVFIVDDHAGYRAVAAAVIDATPGFTLVGSAATGSAALQRIPSTHPGPDLVLMDVNLGDQCGIDITSALIEMLPNIVVLLVSTLDRDDLPEGAETSGAIGYLPKQRLSPATLEQAGNGAYDWRS